MLIFINVNKVLYFDCQKLETVYMKTSALTSMHEQVKNLLYDDSYNDG